MNKENKDEHELEWNKDSLYEKMETELVDLIEEMMNRFDINEDDIISIIQDRVMVD